MKLPISLTGEAALAQINEDHLGGWEHAEFEDPDRVLACGEFTLRSIMVPHDLRFGATHPPVVSEYREARARVPPPFFDADGFVIDGTHRLEANAGRVLNVYIPKSFSGCLCMGNATSVALR